MLCGTMTFEKSTVFTQMSGYLPLLKWEFSYKNITPGWIKK